jgi:hypothetical protein
MDKRFVGLAAAVLTGLFVVSSSVEPAAARSGGGGHGGGGGHSAGGGGGGHSYSGGGGGGRSFSGGGGRSFSGSGGRSSSGPRVSGGNRGGSRVYGYQARGHHHHGHGHGRRFIAVPYGYSDYGYYNGTCAYEYERAVATGSAYWWNRYQDCID